MAPASSATTVRAVDVGLGTRDPLETRPPSVTRYRPTATRCSSGCDSAASYHRQLLDMPSGPSCGVSEFTPAV
ncbi:hypothetical protein [Streptomyces purpurascens]